MVVAVDLANERRVLVAQLQVSVCPAPFVEALHRTLQSILGRGEVNRKLPSMARSTDVREAEEVKRGRLALALAAKVFRCESPEGDELRLLFA